MVIRSSDIRRALVRAGIAVVIPFALLAGGARAQAPTPWGELAHTRLEAGVEPGKIEFAGDTAYAVDPSDGSFYVADETSQGLTPEFRIQRFNMEGKVEASTTFTPPESKKSSTGNAGEEIQLAVDPAHNRLYALIVYRRREVNEAEEKLLEKEEEKLEKEGKKCERPTTCYSREPLDHEELAAGELYAFNYKGGQLVSAKTGAEGAVPIVTEGAFKAQGESPKEALLNPRGLAVEPQTGDIAITGDEDEQENLKVEKEEGIQECRAAAQFISVQESKSTGELSAKFGPRFVDNHEIFKELSCEEVENVPYSPVMTSGGRLLAEDVRTNCPHGQECEGGEIWEIPKSTSDPIGETAGVLEYGVTPSLLYRLYEPQSLVRFGPEEVAGPTMSFVPDAEGSSEGKLYLTAEVEGQKGEFNSAALVLGYSEAGATPQATELGWTGGADEAGGAHEACVIPRPSGEAFLVGGFKDAGSGQEGIVAFDAFEHEKSTVIKALELGPGGDASGCPDATATPPRVEVDGVAVTKLLPDEAATFSSTVEAANVTGVEWRFEDITTGKTVTASGLYEFQEPTVSQAFSEEGEYNVTEVLDTDNLASPVIEAKLTHAFTIKLAPPTFLIEGPTSVENGQEVTYEAAVSDDNKGANSYHYVWKFGDGGEETGETKTLMITVKHTYHKACPSCAVTLVVTDNDGAKGEATANVVVRMDAQEVIAQKEREAKELAERQAKERAEREQKEREARELKERQEKENAGKTGTVGPQGAPEAKLAGSTLSVSPKGTVTVKVSCGGSGSCSGTITLRTASAVAAHAHKKAILTLASGSYSVAAGQSATVTLKLTSKARTLLQRSHTLRALATLTTTGASVSKTTVTLRLSKAPSKHKR